MKKQSFAVMLGLLLFALSASHTASAADTKSQLIQIQTQLQLMQDNMSRMQQSFDERMGVMKDLLTQQTDNVNKRGRLSRTCRNLWDSKPLMPGARSIRFQDRCRPCMMPLTN
jgi:curli biogenesis system outer membrane secretion channel CsgG